MADLLLTLIQISLVSIGGLTVWVLMSYNRVHRLRARCGQAQGDIDVQLKRRADLLPNLTSTVTSAVGQEDRLIDTLRDLQMHANEQANVKATAKRNNNISASMTSIFSSLDTIPRLASNTHYIALREELADTEARIAAARQFLNMAVAEYNTQSAQFPASLFTGNDERRGYDLGPERAFHEDAPVLKL